MAVVVEEEVVAVAVVAEMRSLDTNLSRLIRTCTLMASKVHVS